MGINEVAGDVLVDALGDDVDEAESGATRDGRRVRCSQRQNRKEWRTGKFGGKRGRLPGIFVRRAKIDQRGVYQHLSENSLELFGGAGRDDTPTPSGKRSSVG